MRVIKLFDKKDNIRSMLYCRERQAHPFHIRFWNPSGQEQFELEDSWLEKYTIEASSVYVESATEAGQATVFELDSNDCVRVIDKWDK